MLHVYLMDSYKPLEAIHHTLEGKRVLQYKMGKQVMLNGAAMEKDGESVPTLQVMPQ